MAQFNINYDDNINYIINDERKIEYLNPNYNLRTTEYKKDTWPKGSNASGIYHLDNLLDDSGNNNDIEIYSGTTGNFSATQAIFKKLGLGALQIFNQGAGVKSFAKIPLSTVSNKGSFTICGWFYNNVSIPSVSTIFGTGNTSGNVICEFYQISGTSGRVIISQISGTVLDQSFSFTFNLNEWYFFALKKERIDDTFSNYVFYINDTKIFELNNILNADFITGNSRDYWKIGQSAFSTDGTNTSNVFNGYIDELVFIKDEYLTNSEIETIYNEQSLNYWTDKPYLITKNFSDVVDILSFLTFAETKNGNGILKYKVSNDNGSNWYYWNGAIWTLTDLETKNESNLYTTINTNISSFDSNNNQIKLAVYFESDGSQYLEIQQNIIGYDNNQPPDITIGTDKNYKDLQSNTKPFDDTTISDFENSLQNYFKWFIKDTEPSDEEYNIESQGAFVTLQEAIQSYVIAFDYNNGATQKLWLKVEDTDGKFDVAFKTITVDLYNLDLVFKDEFNNELKNLEYKLSDVEPYVPFDSPLHLEFQRSDLELDILFEKLGFASLIYNYTPNIDQSGTIIMSTGGISQNGSEITIDVIQECYEILILANGDVQMSNIILKQNSNGVFDFILLKSSSSDCYGKIAYNLTNVDAAVLRFRKKNKNLPNSSYIENELTIPSPSEGRLRWAYDRDTTKNLSDEYLAEIILFFNLVDPELNYPANVANTNMDSTTEVERYPRAAKEFLIINVENIIDNINSPENNIT